MNPDQQHLLEYNNYLQVLTLQAILNLTPLKKQWRLERIESVKNCIEMIKNKEKNQL